MNKKYYFFSAILIFVISSCTPRLQGTQTKNDLLFSQSNLVAWCTIPYDSKKRNSEERAVMLKDLGFTSFAYDWRAQDLPNMETELATLKKHGIRLKSVWFWVNGGNDKILDEANETILKTLEKTNTKTELWVSFPSRYFEGIPDEEKIQKGVKTLQYIQERASEIGCSIALYNHEDWFGEPENEVKIIKASGLKNVGIVYNFHHGHKQMDDFDNILQVTKPYLTTVNLNGMKGDKFEIRTIGQGDRELELLKKLKASGFNGSIGIIGHTENEDVKVVLQRNLTGLKRLLGEMGETAH
ncbi:MAG: xylose isomerase domain protein barrel [Ferruginibacter sp.]|nr:xylose isomerase domain protein barrel [Ferruginibacter sp.]